MTVQRRFLLGSRWTAVVALAGGERHFEVIEVPRGPTVTVRAVLTDRTYAIELASLDDPHAWVSGWQQL